MSTSHNQETISLESGIPSVGSIVWNSINY